MTTAPHLPATGTHEGATVVRLPAPPSTRIATVQGTLALDLGPRLEPPEPALAGPATSSGADVPGLDVVPVDLVRRRRFEQHAARICAAMVEIVGGDRPVSQVLRWTSPDVYQDLARRAHLVAAAVGRRPGTGGIQSVRPQLVALHTSFVTQHCAEVSVHVRYGARSRAVAARFEVVRDRWQVTALEFA